MSNTSLKEKYEASEAKELAQFVSKMFDERRNVGVPTGFNSLDSLVGGIRSSTLTVLGGATGMGKSIFGLSVLVNLAKAGHSVAYFDLENGREESFKRILSSWFELPASWFDNKNNQKETIRMVDEINQRFIYWGFEDVDAWTKEEDRRYDVIAKIMRALHQDRKIKAKYFLIDPLQALETHDNPHAALNQQGKIIRVFKELAQEINVSIIVCHHIRKASSSTGAWVKDVAEIDDAKYRVPSIEDLKGSSKISDYAHMVWGLVRMKDSKKESERKLATLRVLKNRSGMTGDVSVWFDEKYLRFVNPKHTGISEAAGIFNNGGELLG